MGVYLNISAADRALHIQLLHDQHDLYKRPCVLIYPGEMMPCENCNADSVGAMPGNYWADGSAFTSTDACLACGGTHYRMVEVEESVDMVLDWNPKEYREFGGNVKKPNGLIKARGKMNIWPKVSRANKILVSSPIQSLSRIVFERASEPIDENNFFHDLYFSVLLSRV